MKSKTILRFFLIVVILISVFLTGFYTAKESDEAITSQIFRRSEARANIGEWGEMDLYTSGNTYTFGAEEVLTALTDILPGKSVHPSHRHGVEEFLVITRGTGEWSLKGQKIQAKTGDLMYISPWDFHGLVNTGSDTLTFFVIRWKNKLMDVPPEPAGDHGQ